MQRLVNKRVSCWESSGGIAAYKSASLITTPADAGG